MVLIKDGALCGPVSVLNRMQHPGVEKKIIIIMVACVPQRTLRDI